MKRQLLVWGRRELISGALRKKAPFFWRIRGWERKRLEKNPKQKEKKQDRRSKLYGNRKERIAELLEKIEAQLDVGKMRITLADFIRLTQLERELEQDDQPREIVVTWKDPSEKNVG